MPRVKSAAFALSPNPSPSQIPAAIPITFFSAPASSTPTRSVFVYTRNRSVPSRCCAHPASPRSAAAITTEVGSPRATSSAWLGPPSTANVVIGLPPAAHLRRPEHLTGSVARIRAAADLASRPRPAGVDPDRLGRPARTHGGAVMAARLRLYTPPEETTEELPEPE